MKKINNHNNLAPHLLCFWIKGNQKEGVVVKTRNKTNEDKKDKTNTDKDDDEDILYTIFIKKLIFNYFH